MEQESDSKIELKDKIILFLKENKYKVILLILVFLTTIFLIFFLKHLEEKKNNIISHKFIDAGILLSKDEKDKSKKILEEIINSKNEFYSVLALNIIIEKNLEKDKKKIISYFETLEDLSINEDRKNLLILKKALYQMKNSNVEEGKEILKSLVESNSKFKEIAKEILDK